MIGILDIDGGDVVSQQDYLIGVQLRRVFARQGRGRDETAFHHAGKEGPRAGKGVEHMHAGIRQGAPESRLQDIGHGTVDEVHDLHGGIDDAEFFHRAGKGRAEKFVVQFHNDALPGFGIVEAGNTHFDGLVKARQHDRILFQRLRFQQIEHGLQGAGNGIVPHKGIVCEQGFKDRPGDEVLGQHLHHLAGGDGGIDVLAQPGQEVVKGGLVRAGNGDQAVDAFHIALSDPGNVRRPLFPVAFVADLLHHAGINGPLQFLKMRQGQRELGRRAASLACRGHSAFLLRRVSVGNAADEHRAAVLRLVAVQLQLVDHGAETVIMRPQGIEDCPDHGKTLVVVEGFFRRHSGRDEDGNDDVAEFLARRGAHDAPHGLHHVDLGIAGRKEQHRVQRGHVHAFGKAAHIGQDAAFIPIGRGGIKP